MATPTVEINPNLIRWAVNRSGLSTEVLRRDFKKIDDWITGDRQPTFRQLENFAKKTMTPFGFLFLPEPPVETVPIPDYRTVGDVPIDTPSPNLIDTITTMQRRQAWMREYRIETGHEKLAIVGAGQQIPKVKSLAQMIRRSLGLSPDWAESLPTWEDALKSLRRAIEGAGVIVFGSSVAGSNNHRGLDPEEFRGFVLCDEYAPLIFVNTADAKSAQMFTLAHELAHVWLNADGLFNLVHMLPSSAQAEKFCNQVAAEFLVPEDRLRERWSEAKSNRRPFHAIAKMFKASPVVVARRALDLQLISRPEFFRFYEQDQSEWRKRRDLQKKSKGGPSLYVVADSRLSQSFVNALVSSTREGRTLYRDAYALIDMKGETFNSYANIVAQRMIDERQ